MKYCPHNFLVPREFSARQSAADCIAFGRVSPFCVQCWEKQGKEPPAEYRREIGKPLVYGHCDLIAQVARKRGFARDSATREDIEADLRLHLLEKQAEIAAGIAGNTEEHARNYVRKVLQNLLTDKQAKSSEGKVIRNTVKSLSPEGLVVTSRKQAAQERACDLLTDLTGGDPASAQDDYTLDGKDALFAESPNSERRAGKRSEAGRLFDTMLQEASSQIATLTGGRQDGFDVPPTPFLWTIMSVLSTKSRLSRALTPRPPTLSGMAQRSGLPEL